MKSTDSQPKQHEMSSEDGQLMHKTLQLPMFG
jgi:hypothetical protein